MLPPRRPPRRPARVVHFVGPSRKSARGTDLAPSAVLERHSHPERRPSPRRSARSIRRATRRAHDRPPRPRHRPGQRAEVEDVSRRSGSAPSPSVHGSDGRASRHELRQQGDEEHRELRVGAGGDRDPACTETRPPLGRSSKAAVRREEPALRDRRGRRRRRHGAPGTPPPHAATSAEIPSTEAIAHDRGSRWSSRPPSEAPRAARARRRIAPPGAVAGPGTR